MNDFSELKKLAEAAPEGPWFGPEYAAGTSYVFDADLGTLLHYESIDTEQDDCLRYVAAANPVALLALIAEVEGLRAQHGRDSAELRNLCQARYDARKERDQLKAEVEALRNLARELRGSAECTNVHHCKSEQHDLDEPCKVLARIDAVMSKGDKP